jgi:micrococcal nuclease
MSSAQSVRAQTIADDLEFLRSAHVHAVLDGDTLTLADGSQVRLVGIMAPKFPNNREDAAQQPFAQEARDALNAMVWDRDIDLYTGGASADRHGRILAHVFTQDGIWVQGALLDQGLARTYSFADNRAVVDLMLEHEERARIMGLGLWSHPLFQVRDAGEPGLVPVDSIELIEGTVVIAAEFDRRIYLNFGEDWRQDVTVTVSPNNRAIFREAGLDFAELEGKRIRVRGWTQWYNGPVIEIDHPEQIEVFEQ